MAQPTDPQTFEITHADIAEALAPIGGVDGLLMMAPGILGLDPSVTDQLGQLLRARAPITVTACISGGPTWTVHVK